MENLAYIRGLRFVITVPVKPRFLIWDVTKCLQIAGAYANHSAYVRACGSCSNGFTAYRTTCTLHIIMAMWVEPLTKRDPVVTRSFFTLLWAPVYIYNVLKF